MSLAALGVLAVGAVALRPAHARRRVVASAASTPAQRTTDSAATDPPATGSPATNPPATSPPATGPVTATTGASTATTTDPGVLTQTSDRPSGADPAFQGRMHLLVQAVATGDASVALPAFFPLHAYTQVKAVRDPAGDWQGRLVALFDSDIAGLHASLGAGAGTAQLAGVDVPDATAAWVGPGIELNRIGYWRVYDTRVRYTVGGRAGSFVVISLISWRGEWYVVHLRTPPR